MNAIFNRPDIVNEIKRNKFLLNTYSRNDTSYIRFDTIFTLFYFF